MGALSKTAKGAVKAVSSGCPILMHFQEYSAFCIQSLRKFIQAFRKTIQPRVLQATRALEHVPSLALICQSSANGQNGSS